MLQKLLLRKNHSFLVAKFAHYSLQKLLVAKITCYSLQNSLVTSRRSCSSQKITCYSLQKFLIAGCRSGTTLCNFINKRLQHRCFLVNFCEILRAPILQNISERLLLKIIIQNVSKRFTILV